MLVADVTSSPGRSLSSPANERMLAPRGYFAIYKNDFLSERSRTNFTIFFSCLVVALLALQSRPIQKELVLKLATQQSILKILSQVIQFELKLFSKIVPLRGWISNNGFRLSFKSNQCGRAPTRGPPSGPK